jgi:hypothetical protein
MLASYALFTVMSAMVKHLADSVPVFEMMFFRSAFALPVVLLIAHRGGGIVLRTRRLGGHALRACTGISAQSLGFFALTLLPLAEQSALGYTQPLFVTLLAIPFLGERVGPARWAAVLAGFAGVLVIAVGQGASFGAPALGIAAGIAQGMFSALTTMLVRQLSATESSSTITIWQSILMAAFAAATLPFVWVTPSWGTLGLLILMGLVGGAAQWLLTEAWASAQVSAIAPYSYAGLLWAALLGWLVWGDVPGPAMGLGALLIVGAGLAILRTERGGKGKV